MDGDPYGFDPNEAIPDWGTGGRVHNWRNHVGEETRKIWQTLSPDQRRAVALDADVQASAEEWD